MCKSDHAPLHSPHITSEFFCHAVSLNSAGSRHQLSVIFYLKDLFLLFWVSFVNLASK